MSVFLLFYHLYALFYPFVQQVVWLCGGLVWSWLLEGCEKNFPGKGKFRWKRGNTEGFPAIRNREVFGKGN